MNNNQPTPAARIAQLENELYKRDVQLERIAYIASQLPEDEVKELMLYVDYLASKRGIKIVK